MQDGKMELTYYHSAICPRCRISGLLLQRVLREQPHVKLTKIEFLTNRRRAREHGIRSIPALVAGERVMTGVLLTPARIRRFLESLKEARKPSTRP